MILVQLTPSWRIWANAATGKGEGSTKKVEDEQNVENVASCRESYPQFISDLTIDQKGKSNLRDKI